MIALQKFRRPKNFLFPLLQVLMGIQYFFPTSAYSQDSSNSVNIQIEFSKPAADTLKPIWAFFGYDEPNYTYMHDGKKLLSELSSLSPVPVYVRVHNLLTSGNGIPALKWGSTNAYTEDPHGNPVYDWHIVDSIFDTYIKLGMRPIAQIGFMPEAMSTHPESDLFQETPDHIKVYHYTGWNYPPKSYEKFAALVYEWVKHSVSRYGQKQVENWYWEVWNEPDIFYWKGTTEEYIKLYDYAADAVKRALPSAQVGGPETTNPSNEKAALFLKTFLIHIVEGVNQVTGRKGAPLDFITFHAKGDPTLINGRVWMNMGRQLRNIDKGFEIIASYPSLKNLPVIIGESDPEGCAACSEDVYPQNAYRNGTLYASYTAASFAGIYDLAKDRGIHPAGAVTWAFEFEHQPWFRGFRDLATNGVDKPVLNIFRMFGMLRGHPVPVHTNPGYSFIAIRDSSVRGMDDVNAMATINKNTAIILVWNYHDENNLQVPPALITLMLKDIPASPVLLTEYRVDQEHSNSFEVWKKMGSPKNPDPEQYKTLEKAGQLQTIGSPGWITPKDNTIQFQTVLPRQGVSLFQLTW